jgi:hypothetical protein
MVEECMKVLQKYRKYKAMKKTQIWSKGTKRNLLRKESEKQDQRSKINY